ncbi:RNA polymerase sporulation sigma factor SigH [Sporohalobacter salinus]|uniref:RNA polymerase sporulation sigma factor SigH n=1 Tax=Sporohalobacter salinus TaxID=1494606 RepID=UPI00196143BB|nr:RNA polymerase sporulation sigma factor SigH [Sporohalobacter salinus]MBM7623966.1 RNA polymerase sporulation-specific sigma factor [Sporohalobacter salinus]
MGIELTKEKYEEYNEYDELTDDELVQLAQSSNQLAMEYLLKKYKSFVRNRARSYFLIGADRDDLIQEGMIGLYKAICDYEVEKLASFRSFAELCITRQLITAIKKATRQKHQPLNSYVSFSQPIYDQDSTRTLLDVLEGSELNNPEEQFISYEAYELLEENIKEMLSELELNVLLEYLEGKTYEEIATALDRHVKSVDNALQRIKKKVENFLEENDI